MNLYFLRYFTDTYRLKSISLSAKANNVSKNAVSKGIKTLEESLGIELIKHKKNHLNFTKQADRIYNNSIEILNKVSDLSNEFKPMHQKTKIGVIHSLATGRLSQVISDLSEKMDIEVLIGNPTEIKNFFSRYLIDIGITLKRDKEIGHNETCLHKGNFELFQSSDSSVRRKIIYLTPDWPEVEAFKKSCELYIDPSIKICVIDSWDAIYSAVKKGKGYGLLPDYFKISNKKIKQTKVSSFKFSYSIVLKYQNNFNDSDIVKSFLERF